MDGKHHPQTRFERYSDDIIVHCVSEKQAWLLLSRITKILHECKLSVNEEKTKIVFCHNESNRGPKYRNEQFSFLGYTFKPRFCPTRNGLKLLTAACMSESSKNEVRNHIRKFSIRKFRGNIQQMSAALNHKIVSWLNYYYKFHKWTTVGVWYWLNKKLIEWTMCNKGIGKRKSIRWLESVYGTRAAIFAHWSIAPPVLGKRVKPNFRSAG